jgi:hypothetical protein
LDGSIAPIVLKVEKGGQRGAILARIRSSTNSLESER